MLPGPLDLVRKAESSFDEAMVSKVSAKHGSHLLTVAGSNSAVGTAAHVPPGIEKAGATEICLAVTK